MLAAFLSHTHRETLVHNRFVFRYLHILLRNPLLKLIIVWQKVWPLDNSWKTFTAQEWQARVSNHLRRISHGAKASSAVPETCSTSSQNWRWPALGGAPVERLCILLELGDTEEASMLQTPTFITYTLCAWHVFCYFAWPWTSGASRAWRGHLKRKRWQRRTPGFCRVHLGPTAANTCGSHPLQDRQHQGPGGLASPCPIISVCSLMGQETQSAAFHSTDGHALKDKMIYIWAWQSPRCWWEGVKDPELSSDCKSSLCGACCETLRKWTPMVSRSLIYKTRVPTVSPT